MVILLVIITAAVLIGVQVYRDAIRKPMAVSEKRNVTVTLPHQVVRRFVHPGHSWAETRGADIVTVGVDDFAQRFIGAVESLVLPQPGERIRQGQRLVTLSRGNKEVSAIAPVSGTIVEVNQSLAKDPVLINTFPYDQGWVAKIAPTNLAMELRNLLHGVTADRWNDALRMQLVAAFSPRIGTVLQDGGHIVNDISSLLSDEDWQRVASEFFTLYAVSHRTTVQPPLKKE